jgi:hypothetical protein
MSFIKGSFACWSNVLVGGLIVAAVLNLLSVWIVYLDIEIWRHDSLYYLQSYLSKLQTEGRWINYLLFSQLKALNPYLSALMHVLFLAIFLTIAAFNACRSIPYALMIMLVCVVPSPVYIQLLWPVTTLPAFTLLAAAAISHKYLPINIFFPIFGILLFASMGHLYFLLPLLYTRRYANSKIPLREKTWMLVKRLVLPWVLGYFAGYGIATVVIYLETGQLGIQLADWRQPNPVIGIESFLLNFATAYAYLTQHLQQYFSMFGWISVVIVLVMFSGSYLKRKQIFHLIIPLLVMLALYASTIPYGIYLSFRTSITLWIGLVFFLFVIPGINRLEMPLFAIAIFLVFMSLSDQTRVNLTWYRESSEFYRKELEAVLAGQPEDYKGVVFLSANAKYPAVEQHINSLLGLGPTLGIKTLATESRWPAIAKAAGFSRIRRCTGQGGGKFCEEAHAVVQRSSVTSPNGLYRVGELQSGWLVVMLAPDFVSQ